VPSLFVIRGNDQGSRWELSDKTLGIGREPVNAIQLHDTEVSRRHAELRQKGREFELVDLSSSNGTFVNNRRVDRHQLESGDEVRIGSTVLLYKGPGDEFSAGLADKIDIISSRPSGDLGQSAHHIRETLGREEGSSLYHASQADKHRNNLEIMYRTVLAVSHTLDIDQLLSRIVQLIFEWVECDRGCIWLVDNETKKLEPKVFRRRDRADSQKITISKTIVDYVMRNQKGVLTSDAKDDTRWNPAASILQHNIHEAICVPMQGRHNNMVGLIYIDTFTRPEDVVRSGRPDKFTPEHLKLMVAIGSQAAMAVEDTRYYSELLQAERLAAVGQTIASLSHHIKNILQGIEGGESIIDMGLTDHSKIASGELPATPESLNKATELVRKGWGMVKKNQGKIGQIVKDMLTLSKEREPDLQASHLNEVTHEVVELMESRARELEVGLSYQLDPQMPVLTFDASGLYTAILNVLTNALDACYERRQEEPEHVPHVKVWTEFRARHGMAAVCVEDNGVGIPADAIEKIFVVFNSTKKGGRGTGLGLSVTNKIMREHNGKVEVKSEVGRGSRFTLLLPALPLDSPPEEEIDPRRTVSLHKQLPPLPG